MWHLFESSSPEETCDGSNVIIDPKQRSDNYQRPTIEETKWNEIREGDYYRQMLDVVYLYGDEPASGKHDGCHRESVRIRQVCQIREDSDNDDGQNHQCPVDRRDIYLALDGFRSVAHAERGERFGVDDLLDQTEGCGDHCLRCNQLIVESNQ